MVAPPAEVEEPATPSPGVQELVFGPIIEQVIEPGNASRQALKLSSGAFVTPSAGEFDFGPNGQGALRAAGVDLYFPRQEPGVAMHLTALDWRMLHDAPSGNPEVKYETVESVSPEIMREQLDYWNGEGWKTNGIPVEKFAFGSCLSTSSFLLVFLSSSPISLETLFHTSTPHSTLNEPGIAVTNKSISASSVRLSTSHRIARSSRPLRPSVSSIASCICPWAMSELTDFISPSSPRSLYLRLRSFWATNQIRPENEFWYGDCGYITGAIVVKT